MYNIFVLSALLTFFYVYFLGEIIFDRRTQNLKGNNSDDAGRLSYEEAVEKAGEFILILPGMYSKHEQQCDVKRFLQHIYEPFDCFYHLDNNRDASCDDLTGNFSHCGLLLMYDDSKKLLLLLVFRFWFVSLDFVGCVWLGQRQ